MARPTVMTEEVISKLESLFRDGAHIYEACKEVKIDPSTYYKQLKENMEFSNRMELAQEYTTEIARAVVSRSIKRGRTEDAKWWLERRVKDKFSTRSEHTGADGKDLPTPILTGVIDVRSDHSSNETE